MADRKTSSAEGAPDPDLVNPADPDAEVLLLGNGPPATLDGLYETIAHAMGLAAENAVQAQQQAAVTAEAATAKSLSALYAIDFAALMKRPA
jgi:hypothetical protein